jgi:hypothetical protein
MIARLSATLPMLPRVEADGDEACTGQVLKERDGVLLRPAQRVQPER